MVYHHFRKTSQDPSENFISKFVTSDGFSGQPPTLRLAAGVGGRCLWSAGDLSRGALGKLGAMKAKMGNVLGVKQL